VGSEEQVENSEVTEKKRKKLGRLMSRGKGKREGDRKRKKKSLRTSYNHG